MKIFWILSLLFGSLENTSAQNITKFLPSGIDQPIIPNDSIPTQYPINSTSETPTKDCYGISFEYIYISDSSVTVTGKFYGEPFILKFDPTINLDSSDIKNIKIDPITKSISLEFKLYEDIFLIQYSNNFNMTFLKLEDYLQHLLNQSINQEDFIPLDETILKNMLRYFQNLPRLKVILEKNDNTYVLSIDPIFNDESTFGEE